MARKQMRQILRPAPKNSKAGWELVSGHIPPETAQRLDDLAAQRPAFRSDLVREAIDLLLEREAA